METVTEPVGTGLLPPPLTETPTESDCAVVIENVAGVTVTVGVVFGEAKVAVTVVLALIVTWQTAVAAVVHPAHEEKVLLPAFAGAVTVTTVPELYVRVKVALPFVAPLLSAGETVMLTPVAGLTEFTVRVKVVGGGGVVDPPPPPHAVNADTRLTATQSARLRRKFFIRSSPELEGETFSFFMGPRTRGTLLKSDL